MSRVSKHSHVPFSPTLSAVPSNGMLPQNPRLSVVLIVCDEVEEIVECLGELSWADELVVLDTGSSDGTQELVQPLVTTLSQIERWPGFGRARQLAETYATGEWILVVDADERLSPELRDDIRRVVALDDRTTVYSCRVESWCFGRRIRFGGWSSFWVTRLYPRGGARWDDARVHERLRVPEGTTRARLQGHLINHTYRTRHECEMKLARYATDWADEHRDRMGSKHRLPGPTVRGWWTFVKSYLLRLGFLDGLAGLALALAMARYTSSKYRLLKRETTARSST